MARAPRSGATRRVWAPVLVLALFAAGTGLWTFLRFNADVSAALAHAALGGVVVQTRCGPIEYEQAGQGVPLLMIHGSGGGHDQGMAFARALAQQGMQVIAPSRFGYLGTPLPADASPATQADAHACLLDALGIGRAAVVGASAGALSALQMAIRHPGRVASLTLVVPITYRPTDTTGSAPASSPWAEKLLLALIGSDLAYWSAMHLARDQVIQRVLATPPAVVAAASPDEQARVHAMVRDILPVSVRADGLRNETRVIAGLQPDDLSAIRAPTLLISARDDGYGSYANAEYTASRIAGARFIGFERGGHVLVGHQDDMQRALVNHVMVNARP
jgi:2-hydroxy-6-oxonona-2,4-dienedioate hydrolase